MKCQILFPRKNKKNIISWSPAEIADNTYQKIYFLMLRQKMCVKVILSVVAANK